MKRPPKTLRPIYPNAGIEAEYRRKLDRLITAMHRSVVRHIRAAYRAQEERITSSMAQDASPAAFLQKQLEKLMRRWVKRFEDAAPKIARWLAGRTRRITADALNNALREAGLTVRCTPSRRAQDMAQSIVEANVALIKSIPVQYHADVAGLVQRSVQAGRDIAGLTDDLQRRFGVTRRRAQFIARDQNNKATEALRRVQDEELGISEGIWVHVPGRKSSRASHIKMGGVRFKIAEGCFDPAVNRKVHPGELPGCQCIYKPIIPQLGDDR